METPTDSDLWRDRLDTTCALERSAESGTTVGSFRVTEVTDAQRSGVQERFSILLEADDAHGLDQGIYDISFGAEVAASLFLVPVSPTALEAVVNRLVDVDEQAGMSA